MSYAFDEGAYEDAFRESHSRCETCQDRICSFAGPTAGLCLSVCHWDHEPVAFEHDSLRYCGTCANEARATLAEDIAAELRRALNYPWPCPTCGGEPETDVSSSYPTVSCGSCFDADFVGDPPGWRPLAPIGAGNTLTEAIASWNDAVEAAVLSASAKKVVTVSIVLDIEGSEADALHVIDRLLDNGFAQDPINEHEVEGADALHVAAAVVRLGAPPVVKPADRHKGSVHEHVRVQVRGESTLVTVMGPGDAKDDVSMWSDGAGVSTFLRLPRDAARRLGELLVQAADDVPVAPAPAAEGGAA